MVPAKSWIEIDRAAYTENLHAIESRLKDGVTLCVVVKANAYGHDTATIVDLALAQGVRHFGVDSIDEAIVVRKRSADAIIFILGYTVCERLTDVVAYETIQTVYTGRSISLLAEEARRQQMIAQVNLKVETGTNRQGVGESDLKHLLADIERNRDVLSLVSVSSHFSSSEDLSKSEVTVEQNARFSNALGVIERFGFEPMYKHISCSASTLLYPETQHTMVRVGLAQYGLWSSEALKQALLGHVELTPVLSWKARIAQIKDVPTGVPIGYGQSFIGDRPLRIAIIPVGYYDGYTRLFKNKAYVLVKGQKCRVIGSICMNMCMVDVSAVPGIQEGDIVTLLGRDSMNIVRADDLAQWMGTINYEIPTMIKSHLPRVVV